MSGHGTCSTCKQRIVWANNPNGRNVPLDWPPNDSGLTVAWQTSLGDWFCQPYAHGEQGPGWKRHTDHRETCAGREPVPSVTEPQRAVEPVTGPVPAGQVKAWKAAKRNQRGRRPAAQITGVRWRAQ